MFENQFKKNPPKKKISTYLILSNERVDFRIVFDFLAALGETERRQSLTFIIHRRRDAGQQVQVRIRVQGI